MSHTAAWPLSFCQRKSLRPSWLKSPPPNKCQLGPGLGPTLAAPIWSCLVKQPHRSLTVGVLPQEIAVVDAVKVLVRRARIEDRVHDIGI